MCSSLLFFFIFQYLPIAPFTETPTTIDFASSTMIDTSNPYYLHPCDSPVMILVNSLFDGKGYARWNRAIIIYLSAKSKIRFIDGSSAEPASDSTQHKAWSRCNDMVIS